MMKFFLIAFLPFCASNLFAQKLVIDSVASKNWPSLGGPTISGNGKYLVYNVQNIPVGSRTLVVQATDGKWKKEFVGGVDDGYTTLTGLSLFYLKNDSLGMLTLGTDNIRYMPKISSFSVLSTKTGEYLVYTPNTIPKRLIIKNLKTNKETSFFDVDHYNFNEDVLVLFKSVNGNKDLQSVNLADVNTGKIFKLWEGHKPENLIVDVKHKQLAFKTGDSVCYYKIGSAHAIYLTGEKSLSVKQGLRLGNLEAFSKDGKFLFTSLIETGNTKLPVKGGVEVWSYTDTSLQSEQEANIYEQRYLSVIDIVDHKIVQLQRKASEEFYFAKSKDGPDTLALIGNPERPNEPWNIASKSVWNLISVKDGKRTALGFLDGTIPGLVNLSPSGKFLIYFDNVKKDCYSYEIATGIIRNLTRDINTSWININRDDLPGNGTPRGIIDQLWVKNDQSILIYDRYDIWKLDPLNKQKPINLTNGYGKKHHTVFSFMRRQGYEEFLNKDSRVYLTAFDNETKENGFFSKTLNKTGDPEFLTMRKGLFQSQSNYVDDDLDFVPIKAKNADIYIVKYRNPVDAPNYFSTRNFKTFIRLSNYQPQEKYNWYTTELHKWQSLDGRSLYGILYKPENFDPQKKYPVIFHYYERKSDGLNSFIYPESLSSGMNINIPSYVSNGYLVFCPDIYYKIGEPMKGTYNAVISCARYVSNLPFVDKTKLGIQGGSWGGYQTNYLITHSTLFAAAVSSAGVANWVSNYGGLVDKKMSQESNYEASQMRAGGSLWEKPEVYITNSPIFKVDKVTTPILIMHAKDDGICLYSNIMEFYTGLRRMGKKAWMLAYSDGNHGIGGKDAEDFSIRMMQFFDHYLKNKPAPVWMTRGISADKRGVENGYEYDTEIKTPGAGLLNAEEQKKADSLMIRKPITITLK